MNVRELEVSCPFCRAAVGQRCSGMVATRDVEVDRWALSWPHLERIRAAGL